MNVGYDLGKGKGSINHLLLMDDLKLYGKNVNQLDTLVNILRIFSSDIGMKFGLQKCRVLMMKKENYVSSNGVKMLVVVVVIFVVVTLLYIDLLLLFSCQLYTYVLAK